MGNPQETPWPPRGRRSRPPREEVPPGSQAGASGHADPGPPGPDAKLGPWMSWMEQTSARPGLGRLRKALVAGDG